MGYWPVALEGEGSNCFSITWTSRTKSNYQGKQKWTRSSGRLMIGPSFQQFVEFSLVHRMHVVVVYDGKRAAMKAERLWHLHFQCWLLLFLWSHRKSVSSIKLFRCWGTLEYKSLWFCAVTRDQAAQYVRHVLSLLKGTPGTVRFKGVVWFVSSDSVNMRAFNVVIWEHCNGCSSDAVVSWMILYT